MTNKLTDQERFLAKIDTNGPIPAHRPDIGPCHLWKASCNKDGYGQFRFKGRCELSHRVAFFMAHGHWPQPSGCHHCDNPACVNVDHIFEGSHEENMGDMWTKGRQVFGPSMCRLGENHHSSKFTEAQIVEIRFEYENEDISQLELANRYGVCQSTIGKIVRKKNWKHV